jgi:AAA+ ATPase superfamily predicted ATPase
MYFELGPKMDKKALFDFEDEYQKLKEYAMKNKLTVISGLRRTGKSSFLHVVYNELKCPKVFIDVRALKLSRKVFWNEFIAKLIDALHKAYPAEKISDLIKGIEVGLVRISFKEENPSFCKIIEKLDESKCVIFVDEAQLLRKIGADYLFAYIFDNTKNINVVMAGSEVGLLQNMFENSKNPLYGRPYLKIGTRYLTEEEGKKFLREGFRQVKFKISEADIEEIVKDFDGNIGWLTMAGYYISMERDIKKGIERTIETGKKLVKDELNKFLSGRVGRERYVMILKLLKSDLRWSEIKRGFEAKFGKISDKQLTDFIKTLLDYGFIGKKDNLYYIPDPLLKRVV